MTLELNLENLKIGDKITTVSPDGKVYASVGVITKWDDRIKRWRYARPNNLKKTVGTLPPLGHGMYFMSKSKTPDFYYSANPEHVKKAERNIKTRRKRQEQKQAEQDRRMALARPIGDLFKTEYYDSEECYHLDSTDEVTETLIKRLTDEQIETLKGWLNV